MLRSTAGSVAASMLLAAFLAGPCGAAEEKGKERAAPEDESETSPYDAATSRARTTEGEVFTNEDLERLMEAPPGEALRKAEPAPPKPAPTPRKAKAAKPKTVVAPAPQPKTRNELEAESRVAALEARVLDLERAVLAARNPALPREWTRPKTDKPGTAGASAQARQAQLRRAREDLSRARQELARWRGEAP